MLVLELDHLHDQADSRVWGLAAWYTSTARNHWPAHLDLRLSIRILTSL
jgi:hypothetical protein